MFQLSDGILKLLPVSGKYRVTNPMATLVLNKVGKKKVKIKPLTTMWQVTDIFDRAL